MVGITAPYQIHHGDNDNVVPRAMDPRLASRLASRGRRHELHVYPGGTHNDVPAFVDVEVAGAPPFHIVEGAGGVDGPRLGRCRLGDGLDTSCHRGGKLDGSRRWREPAARTVKIVT